MNKWNSSDSYRFGVPHKVCLPGSRSKKHMCIKRDGGGWGCNSLYTHAFCPLIKPHTPHLDHHRHMFIHRIAARPEAALHPEGRGGAAATFACFDCCDAALCWTAHECRLHCGRCGLCCRGGFCRDIIKIEPAISMHMHMRIKCTNILLFSSSERACMRDLCMWSSSPCHHSQKAS
jgi:hypothetical protein